MLIRPEPPFFLAALLGIPDRSWHYRSCISLAGDNRWLDYRYFKHCGVFDAGASAPPGEVGDCAKAFMASDQAGTNRTLATQLGTYPHADQNSAAATTPL